MSSPSPSSSLAQVRQARLDKIQRLREMGLNPYPSRASRTHFCADILERFEEIEGQKATVAGRLMSWRKHGALSFGHVQDQTGRVQLYVRRDTLLPTDAAENRLGYEHLNLLDVGDIVEAEGEVVRTERGEISVKAERIRLLTKSIRPLPEKWHGIQDREIILRKRYLDVTHNPEQLKRYELISRMVFEVRRFLDARGFLEFQTPVIQPQYGGGTARPFTTHVNALDCDMYLAISHELYLKRLIAAGFDRVYTVGRYFRNEGIDRTHHPEFSMVETMTAYADYTFNMDLIEELFRHLATHVFGRTTFNVAGHAIDFGQPWRRVSMADAVLEATGVDFRNITSPDQANARLREMGLTEEQPTVGHAMAYAFEEKAAPGLIGPALVYGHPVEISPLAKPMAEDPRFAERFEIFIAGMECGDNWSEQNDPVTLLERWKQARDLAGADPEEHHPLDYDFIEVLEHGIPPTTGIGPGIERMAMIFLELENIDDVIFFPLMKPVVSPVNRAIYGIEERPGLPSRLPAVTLDPESFSQLVRDDVFRPLAKTILVRPHLQVWAQGAPRKAWHATVSYEIGGLLDHNRLVVTGPTLTAQSEEEFERLCEAATENGANGFAETLKEKFRGCRVEFAPVSREHAPRVAQEG